MVRLTERQSRVLDFLRTFEAENEYPAIVTDIQHRFEMGYSTALSTARRLQELGYVDILMERHRIRGVFVLHKE